jgi:uncharacterized protein (DUF885 family)
MAHAAPQPGLEIRDRRDPLTDNSPDFAPLTPDNRPEPRTAFGHALHRYLDDAFEAWPTWATAIGFHAYDDKWPDVSEDGRSSRLAMLRHHRARIAALPESELSSEERVDRGITLEAIDAAEFSEAELREGAWDPLGYIYTAGSGLFNVLSSEYGPWAHRGPAFLGRVRGLGDFLNAAAEALTGVPGRPVSLLHAETALAQLSGIPDLIDQGIAEARRRAAGSSATNDDRLLAGGLEAAATSAKSAVEMFAAKLREEIAPRSEGEGRLGPDLFAQKLRHTLSSDIAPSELADRARGDYDLVRAQMLHYAKEGWAEWQPGQAPADDGDETIRRVLDAVSRAHRQPQELLDFSREEVARIEEFCRSNNVIGLPDDPLQITWTPVFMRAYGGAFLHSPGVLDKGMPSFFWITPPNEKLGPEAVESYLREDNDRMLRLLAIHEGVPGHYLQLSYANRTQNLARGVFGSGMFAEGWAVYVTQVLMDLGYGDFEPALLLNHWKFYLRAITNALMDVAIHTQGMTEEQAMSLMVEGGFQEQHEAKAKWLRARLTSTQLSTYYLGSIEMWEMDVAARKRAAQAAGSDPEQVPAQRIAGGFGLSPDFDYRAHLESVISHGTPPIKWVARILAGEA